MGSEKTLRRELTPHPYGQPDRKKTVFYDPQRGVVKKNKRTFYGQADS